MKTKTVHFKLKERNRQTDSLRDRHAEKVNEIIRNDFMYNKSVVSLPHCSPT